MEVAGIMLALLDIPRDQRGGFAEEHCAGQVNGVVAPQPDLGCEVARSTRNCLIQTDDRQLGVGCVEVTDRVAVRGDRESARAACGGERGTTFGVGEDARGSGMRRVPELRGQLRPVLDHYELYQRRGVEVERQRR